MTKRRFVLFAATAFVLAIVLSSAVVVGGDVYLHHKYGQVAGFNIWGYRGPTVGRKGAEEWRLAVLGESTAFGYGVPWDKAFPAYLQTKMNASPIDRRQVTVVNLAYNGEGAHSYKYTLKDYAYLKPDAILFYSGYNDLGGANTQVFRHTSPVFRATGYMPIFPIIFQEKAMVLRAGNLEEAYGGKKTTFRPKIAARATASALEEAVLISRSLGDQLSHAVVDSTHDEATAEGAPCGDRWAHYCGEMYAAVKIALDQGTRVLLVTQPYMTLNPVAVSLHHDQQRLMRQFLRQKFGDTPRLRFANLGDAVDLKDTSLCYDGMHLTAAGNERIAAALLPDVRALLR